MAMRSFVWNPSAVARALGVSTIMLVLASIAGQLCKYVLGHGSVYGLVPFFYVDAEANLPTAFSVGLLLFAATLLAQVTRDQRRRGAPDVARWALLSAGFVVMAFDEGVSLHERLTPPLGRLLGDGPLGVLHFAWIVPGTALVAVLAVFFRRFLLGLPARTRGRFLLAAALYLGGALGVEALGGAYDRSHGDQNLIYSMLATVEETLEMIGVIVLIHALLVCRLASAAIGTRIGREEGGCHDVRPIHDAVVGDAAAARRTRVGR